MHAALLQAGHVTGAALFVRLLAPFHRSFHLVVPQLKLAAL